MPIPYNPVVILSILQPIYSLYIAYRGVKGVKVNIYRIGEIVVGCFVAIAIAMAAGLENSISAGIIAILSIQDTKRETLRSALERLWAFAIALLLAFAAFSLIGYNLYAFVLYLLPFTLLCYKWHLHASIPICSVLMSHFWLAGHMAPSLVGNECLLMIIGTGTGILLNLFLPTGSKAIREEQQRIETLMRSMFTKMADALLHREKLSAVSADMDALEAALDAAQKKADTLRNNSLSADMGYYVQYVTMRRNQLTMLRRLEQAIPNLSMVPSQAHTLAFYFENIAASLHECNNAKRLLAELESMRQAFRQEALPVTREEFEARATLFRMMIDTEHFLLLKHDFVAALTDWQRKTFLRDCDEG